MQNLLDITPEALQAQDPKIALQGITLLRGHMLYLVHKIRDGIHTSRHKNLGDLAKKVQSPDDYAVMIPDGSITDPVEIMKLVKDPPEDKLIPVGALLARVAEETYEF